MTPARKKRLILVGLMVLGVGAAIALALTAFQKNMMFFFSPTEVVEGKAPASAVFRLGGMVVEGSVERGRELTVRFALTDFNQQVNVEYTGILPDLFREGQGIVAKGRLNAQGAFVADEVLAKHDENYMPPEVADIMQKPKGIEGTKP